MTGPLRGRLLVATPDLDDANFFRTVVLLLEHGEGGALGLVLNRPAADTQLADPLPAWADLAPEPSVFFVGGPVQPDGAIGLARAHGTTPPDGFAPLFDDLGTVDLEEPPDRISPSVDRVRVFVGHSGWGPGQLERELDAGGWFVVPLDASDLWTDTPDGLWRKVLRRQRGSERLFADFPLDARLN